VTITAWHNSPDLKTQVVDRLRQHRAADEIVHGVYQELDPDTASGYRGCAIGCTLPAQPSYNVDGIDQITPGQGWHAQVEAEYGIPATIAHLIDGIFEALPTDRGEHADFAVAVIEAIPVGADLSLVSSRLMLDLLADPQRGMFQLCDEGSDARTAVEAVAGLYVRRLAGDEPSEEDWDRAAWAAWAAGAAGAAWAARAAWAAEAAEAAWAAWAAEAARAAEAAEAARAAEAAEAAEAASWQAERLIHHLTTAPITAPGDTVVKQAPVTAGSVAP